MQVLRQAKPNESTKLLEYIKKIAHYEKLSHRVKASTESLEKNIFGAHPKAFAYFIENEMQVDVGFVLFFFAFSSFSGKPLLYVEDVFVNEDSRNRGYGSKVWQDLIQLAKQHDCSAMVWNVLDWNESAISFYKKLGAEAMSDWTMYRLELDPK